ncbi:MAG TPA: carboxymuconolactone decarboxylase family protein [Dehalococcoidia bacterium]|nr:carboxymuconolactone decarboxylase family protein [Dehalococcoidia bacterium]
MPRLREVPKAEAPPAINEMYERLFDGRDPVAEPGTATGTPGHWWTVFALVPDIFEHATSGFNLFNSTDRALEPRYRELGLTRAGFARGSQFVFSQHCKASRAVGISEEQVAAIPSWATSDLFDDKDRAILAYTDEVIVQDGRVQDGTFEVLHKHFSDEAILELTYAIATYGLHATACRALRLEYDDVPERIAEIPMPGEGDRDIMSDISR